MALDGLTHISRYFLQTFSLGKIARQRRYLCPISSFGGGMNFNSIMNSLHAVMLPRTLKSRHLTGARICGRTCQIEVERESPRASRPGFAMPLQARR